MSHRLLCRVDRAPRVQRSRTSTDATRTMVEPALLLDVLSCRAASLSHRPDGAFARARLQNRRRNAWIEPATGFTDGICSCRAPANGSGKDMKSIIIMVIL